MARMGPSPCDNPTMPAQTGDALPSKTLFQHFLPRYLHHPAVRHWLMDRSPTATRYAANIRSSMSYACMYFPPTSVPRGAAPYPMPQPFLDFGDFMLCENVFDSIAVGTLYNQREDHALAILRDKMLRTSPLSRRPVTRRFAVDLSVSNLEIIEFAWMDDDSLIIACRRLDQPISQGVNPDQLVLTGDLLFYDIIPPNAVPGVPLLRMTLSEKPAICQFCGTRGIKTCSCPSTFKTRAPSAHSVPVPLSHAPFLDNSLSLVPQGPLADMLATWDSYTKRIFSVNTSGAFFVHWYKRSKGSNGMTLFMSPPHPISYQFLCGTRQETMFLASAYVKRMKLCDRAFSADARLYNYLSRGSDIGMLLDKQKSSSLTDDLLVFDDSNSASELSNVSPLSSNDNQYVFEQLDHDETKSPSSVVKSASGRRSLGLEAPAVVYNQYPAVEAATLQSLQNSSGTTTSLSGYSTGPSSDEHASHILTEDYDGTVANQLTAGLKDELQTSPLTEREGPRHVMDNAYDAWGAQGHGTTTGAKAAPSLGQRGQRLTLSTRSRELQQYMTVDASSTPTCKECGSSFPKRGNLARHIQTVHLKLKPFQCDHCPASFGYKNHLKRHQIVHQRGSEFKCQQCPREFKSQVQLTRHLQQSHQSALPEGGSAQQSEVVEKTRVKCDICGVSFSQKSNLSRHKLIHEGLRFVCPVCPDKTSFGQRYDLHRHIIRKHPGVSDSAFVSLTPERIEDTE